MATPDKKPITTVRRQDRAATDEAWMRAFLQRAKFGTLWSGKQKVAPADFPGAFLFADVTHDAFCD